MLFKINDLTWIASMAPISILSTGLIKLRASLAINMQFSLLSNWSADLSHLLISSMSSMVVDFSAVMMLSHRRTTHKWLIFIFPHDLYTFMIWSLNFSQWCDHIISLYIGPHSNERSVLKWTPKGKHVSCNHINAMFYKMSYRQ